MPWSGLPTTARRVDCRPPFSFFFDLIEVYWKHGDPVALHRICTLARKQNASTVVIECALNRSEVVYEIDDLDAAYGGGGTAEAITFSFFSGDEVCSGSKRFLGQAVVINYRKGGALQFTDSYIYEAVVPSPKLLNRDGEETGLLNNFICTDREFLCKVEGQQHAAHGVYYCQQNRVTHVCAHACIRMALNPIGNNGHCISPREINKFLDLKMPVSHLNMHQIIDVIEKRGGQHAEVVDCAEMQSSKYVSVLASIVQSGHMALLVFTTGNEEQHIVTVFGHTRNSDEWHPQAIPEYAGPSSAQYYPSSAWVDHFLIHDDNFGAYYTLGSRALDAEPTVRARWIIAVRPFRPDVRADLAEAFASSLLHHLLPEAGILGNGRWASYLAARHPTPVLRTVLMDRGTYLDDLAKAKGHDNSAATATELKALGMLPDRFWMVEFTLAPLFTGNRSKLGEVLIRTNANQPPEIEDVLLAVRMPGAVLVSGLNGKMSKHHLGLESHSPSFRLTKPTHEW